MKVRMGTGMKVRMRMAQAWGVAGQDAMSHPQLREGPCLLFPPSQYGANESHVDGQLRTPLHWAGECWRVPKPGGTWGDT